MSLVIITALHFLTFLKDSSTLSVPIVLELNVVIGLRIQKGRLIEIQERIAKDSRVHGVYDVTGDFDSMVIARAKNRKDLDDLSKNVLSIDGVERSITHLVLNTVKEKTASLP